MVTALTARSRAAAVVLVVLSRADPGTMTIIFRGPITPIGGDGSRINPMVICVCWVWNQQGLGFVTGFAFVRRSTPEISQRQLFRRTVKALVVP